MKATAAMVAAGAVAFFAIGAVVLAAHLIVQASAVVLEMLTHMMEELT
jgi:hypothetical protein